MRHVYSDLVGSAGFQLQLQQGMAAVSCQNTVMGNRCLGIASPGDCPPGTVHPMASQRRLNASTRGYASIHNRLIFACHTALLQLPDQVLVSGQGFGHHHQT